MLVSSDGDLFSCAEIQDGLLVVLDGAGHVAQYDRPHLFNEAVFAFLAEDQAGTYGWVSAERRRHQSQIVSRP